MRTFASWWQGPCRRMSSIYRVGLLLRADHFRTGRVYGHTLLFFVAVLLVGMWTTRPRSPERKRGMVVAVGVMFHLPADRVWLAPELLLWPLAGWGFPTGAESDWSGLPGSLFYNPARPAQGGGRARLSRLAGPPHRPLRPVTSVPLVEDRDHHDLKGESARIPEHR